MNYDISLSNNQVQLFLSVWGVVIAVACSEIFFVGIPLTVLSKVHATVFEAL